MVRVNVTIDERLLKAIDRRAKRERQSRSEFLRHAVEEYFAQEAAEERRQRAMEKAMATQDRIRAKTRPWDAVGFLRRDRASHR
jgi:metal-responsive CopG/Arc/MetJ family transcriptional regulator